ncbi:MAG: hypothetical protein AMS27_14340 [Bacteroides sp. SM23_62_1]|nr:MAG: hypothetical protein AMS27_14340 [Bacteroides sp. SM23_62_1]
MAVILTIGSCTENFEELNTDPNNPVDVPAINIFTNTIQRSIDRQGGGWIQHTYLGVWCQQWCKVQYIDEDRYQPREMSGDFDGPYIGELADLYLIIEKTTEEGDDLLRGAALVLRSWIYMHLTDMFGDIPYTEALQGFETDGTITPVYDTQESVYMGLLADLETANQLLATSTVNFGSGDILYGGDPVAWRKFANSLKLRILNRCAGTPWSFTYDMVDPQTDVTTSAGAAAYASADADIATILGNPTQYPIFTSNGDDAALVYPGVAPYRNPIFETLLARTDQAISHTMVDWLMQRNDPRIHVYAQPVPNSYDEVAGDYSGLTYYGFQNGRGITAANFPSISLLGVEIAYKEANPIYVLTYDELEFIIAEHYLRQGQDGLARQHYEDGIAASMARWGCTDGGTVSAQAHIGTENKTLPVTQNVDYATYLADPLVSWTAAPDDAHKFQLICEQRWAAIFGQGVQAWHEVRRTGFPTRIFEFELEGAYYPNMGMPVRLQYSLNEETYNAENVTAAKTRQNVELSNEGLFSTNGIQSQMWWNTRKNPIPTEIDIPAGQ